VVVEPHHVVLCERCMSQLFHQQASKLAFTKPAATVEELWTLLPYNRRQASSHPGLLLLTLA
jgi:hypothetical protein